jgi:hypothetical protein
MSSILGEWREGKVRPIPGNAPHDRLVSRGIVSPRSIATIPSPPLDSRCFQEQYRGPRYAFLRHGGIYLVRWGFQIKTKPWVGTRPPPAGRPRAQVKERVGRNTLLLIVRR